MRRSSRLALIYLLALVLIWLLAQLVGERTLPTLLLAYAPPVLWLLPAPFIWLWVLLKRRKLGSILLATLFAVWGAGFLHWRPQSAGELRVLTYNVARGNQTTAVRLADFLKETDADLILLQETNFLDPKFGPALEAALPNYAAAHAAEVTTLSRLPMQAAKTFAFGPPSQRESLLTPVLWQGKNLNIVNVHLGTVLFTPILKGDFAQAEMTRNARTLQVDTLRQIALQTSGPTLLGGDLNTPPRGLIYRRLQNLFGPDAHDRAGRGPGWTFPSLKLRIDHQMTRDLQPTRTRVLGGAGSDHLPLLVEYK